MGFGSVGSQLNRVNRKLQLSIRRSFKTRLSTSSASKKGQKFDAKNWKDKPRVLEEEEWKLGKINTIAILLVALIVTIVLYVFFRT